MILLNYIINIINKVSLYRHTACFFKLIDIFVTFVSANKNVTTGNYKTMNMNTRFYFNVQANDT